jgi:hypothetical protein
MEPTVAHEIVAHHVSEPAVTVLDNRDSHYASLSDAAVTEWACGHVKFCPGAPAARADATVTVGLGHRPSHSNGRAAAAASELQVGPGPSLSLPLLSR